MKETNISLNALVENARNKCTTMAADRFGDIETIITQAFHAGGAAKIERFVDDYDVRTALKNAVMAKCKEFKSPASFYFDEIDAQEVLEAARQGDKEL